MPEGGQTSQGSCWQLRLSGHARRSYHLTTKRVGATCRGGQSDSRYGTLSCSANVMSVIAVPSAAPE